MSSFEFVQLRQTLNDIVAIFPILTLNGFGTKQTYLTCILIYIFYIYEMVYLAMTATISEAVSTHGLHQPCKYYLLYPLVS